MRFGFFEFWIFEWLLLLLFCCFAVLLGVGECESWREYTVIVSTASFILHMESVHEDRILRAFSYH